MAKITLGCEPVVGSMTPSKKREDRVTNCLQEGKRPIHAVVFDFIDSRYFNVFATVGGNRVTVYQCLEGGIFGVLQSYIDEDSFVGHGVSINEIRTQALKPSLVSASKDESVRLWNVHTGICILIFSGAGDHRNEVLSVDFHPSDIYRIASCEFWTYVEKSFTWTDLPSKFPTKYIQFPVFIASVHSNCVDCNRWLGDFILSKSVDNEIVLWEPKTKEQSPGNRKGKIHVWELQFSPPVLVARLTLFAILHSYGCLIFNPNLQSGRQPCPPVEAPFEAAVMMAQSGDGMLWQQHPDLLYS